MLNDEDSISQGQSSLCFQSKDHPFAAAAILATVATEALTTPEPQLRHFTKHICDQYLGFTAYNWFYRELDFCGF